VCAVASEVNFTLCLNKSHFRQMRDQQDTRIFHAPASNTNFLIQRGSKLATCVRESKRSQHQHVSFNCCVTSLHIKSSSSRNASKLNRVCQRQEQTHTLTYVPDQRTTNSPSSHPTNPSIVQRAREFLSCMYRSHSALESRHKHRNLPHLPLRASLLHPQFRTMYLQHNNTVNLLLLRSL